MKYFRLRDDIEFLNRWYLGDIYGIDNWKVLVTAPETTNSLKIELIQDGAEIDFTLSETYGVPIVSEKLRKEFTTCEELDFVSVRVGGKSCRKSYYLMVTRQLADCVDEKESDFQILEKNDPVRPDKSGQYRSFFNLKIDATKVGDLEVFRLKNFETAIVISENIKNKLEMIEATGTDFELVT